MRFLLGCLATDVVGVPAIADTSPPKATGTREFDLTESTQLAKATAELSQTYRRGPDFPPSTWRQFHRNTGYPPDGILETPHKIVHGESPDSSKPPQGRFYNRFHETSDLELQSIHHCFESWLR